MKLSRELQQRIASTNEREPHQWADAASARRMAPPPPAVDVSLGTVIRRYNQMPTGPSGERAMYTMPLVTAGSTDPSGLPDFAAGERAFRRLRMRPDDGDNGSEMDFYGEAQGEDEQGPTTGFVERQNTLDRG